MTEQQIIEGCKAQERSAQQALYEKHARTMYGICLRYSTDENMAKDLLQDGFMKVFNKIPSFEGRGSFEGWMKRIFVNLALELIRKNKTTNFKTEFLENLTEEEIAAAAADGPEGMYAIPIEELLKMIKSLPDGYSTIFNLYAIENYPHKEIAKMLNISEGTSRSQYVRARQVLQKMVKDYVKKEM